MMCRKIVYGAAFLIVLPLLLIAWAAATEPTMEMPVYGSAGLGAAFAACGLMLMATGMFDLRRFGGGLPMNAFPPVRFVSRGSFRYLPHPIYTGFAAVCLGVSMAAKSASGLWLVTPCVILGCSALVLGYEHVDLRRRFGHALQVLPSDDDAVPSTLEQVRFLILVVAPWIALYEFTVHLPVRGTPFGFAFEDHLPILPWTSVFYESVYVAVALAPWCARTRRDLRRLMISAWAATAIVFPIFWFLPSGAPRRELLVGGWLARVLLFERTADAPVAAMPSFHVIWAVIVARLYRPRWLGAAYVTAVAASCVTTGMHYIVDVIVALAIAPVFLQPQRTWEILRRATERLANSWQEWRIGRLRIINYAFYAGAAAFVQLSIVLAALGRGKERNVLVTGLAGLLVSGTLAQWVEGSSRLRRPFGFYGGLIGAGVACLFFRERWILLGAHSLAAPWTQAIGRPRCIVNGCCHGGPASAGVGIRVSRERSRISRIPELAGVPIHATQLYSIIGNVFVGLLLMRFWISGCPLTLIAGVYGIGNGVCRFIEEAYRGEPQTPMIAGLRLYQWFAVGTVMLGAALTTVASAAPPTLVFSRIDLAYAFAFACMVAAAMGIDFPESSRLLARLT